MIGSVAAWYAVSPAVMEEWDSRRSPSDSGVVANKGVPMWGTALWKSLWEFEGGIKVGHVYALQKTPFQVQKVPGISKQVSPCAHLRGPPGPLK